MAIMVEDSRWSVANFGGSLSPIKFTVSLNLTSNGKQISQAKTIEFDSVPLLVALDADAPAALVAFNVLVTLASIVLFVITLIRRRNLKCCNCFPMKQVVMNVEVMSRLKQRDRYADMDLIELVQELFRRPE
jgi:hypothetical protein